MDLSFSCDAYVETCRQVMRIRFLDQAKKSFKKLDVNLSFYILLF